MKYRIKIDQRKNPGDYARVRAQIVSIRKQLTTNTTATITLAYPTDAEHLRRSVIGETNLLMLRGDGETLDVTPKAIECLSCGRVFDDPEDNGLKGQPCPSDDCPSKWEEVGIEHPDHPSTLPIA